MADHRNGLVRLWRREGREGRPRKSHGVDASDVLPVSNYKSF